LSGGLGVVYKRQRDRFRKRQKIFDSTALSANAVCTDGSKRSSRFHLHISTTCNPWDFVTGKIRH
jgi:hypothetical protein